MLGVAESVLTTVSNPELRATASGTRHEHATGNVREHVNLDPQAAARFVVEVARLRMDGEGPHADVEHEPCVMENDDAFTTVHSLIGDARQLLGWEAGKPPLDTDDYRTVQNKPPAASPAASPADGDAGHDREGGA
jgi:hypothetical protein